VDELFCCMKMAPPPLPLPLAALRMNTADALLRQGKRLQAKYRDVT
jgi:hypothetical protein